MIDLDFINELASKYNLIIDKKKNALDTTVYSLFYKDIYLGFWSDYTSNWMHLNSRIMLDLTKASDPKLRVEDLSAFRSKEWIDNHIKYLITLYDEMKNMLDLLPKKVKVYDKLDSLNKDF